MPVERPLGTRREALSRVLKFWRRHRDEEELRRSSRPHRDPFRTTQDFEERSLFVDAL